MKVFGRVYRKTGTPEQPGSAGTDDWDHVQAALIQTIKQDKPLYNCFIVLKHYCITHLAVTWPRVQLQ